MKIGIFGWSSSLSHAGRMVQIARHLKTSGHDVVLFGVPKFLESSYLVHPNEFTLIEHTEDSFQAKPFLNRPDDILELELLHHTREDIQAIENASLDMVISDHRRSVFLAAELLKVPSISITQATSLGTRCNIAIPKEKIEKLFLDKQKRFTGENFKLQERNLPPGILNFIAKYKLKERKYISDLSYGNISLVMDLPSLFPYLKHKTFKIFQLGPLIFTGLIKNQIEISSNSNTKKILLYPGSAQNLNEWQSLSTELFQIEAEIHLINAPSQIQNLFPKALNHRYFDLLADLVHFDMFIHNASSFACYSSMLHEKPSLMLPFNADQKINAAVFSKIDGMDFGLTAMKNLLEQSAKPKKTNSVTEDINPNLPLKYILDLVNELKIKINGQH